MILVFFLHCSLGQDDFYQLILTANNDKGPKYVFMLIKIREKKFPRKMLKLLIRNSHKGPKNNTYK